MRTLRAGNTFLFGKTPPKVKVVNGFTSNFDTTKRGDKRMKNSRYDCQSRNLNCSARKGLWIGAINGESCFLLVVDDLEDDDEDANFTSVIQLSDWDGRPGMSSRVFDTREVLCATARWLGDATLSLIRRFDAAVPPTHVGQIYVHDGRPRLLVLDDQARLREHDLVGIAHQGDDGDGYYEWELSYQVSETVPHWVRILTSAEIDSWINDWRPPPQATALSRLSR